MVVIERFSLMWVMVIERVSPKIPENGPKYAKHILHISIWAYKVALRLFCYQVDRPHPSSGYLGILACRYILTDFYNIQYGNADGRSVRSILRAILTRYHLLVTAKVGFFQRLKKQRENMGLHAPSNKHIRKMISPLYTVDKDFNLETSEGLLQAARGLDIRNIN